MMYGTENEIVEKEPMTKRDWFVAAGLLMLAAIIYIQVIPERR